MTSIVITQNHVSDRHVTVCPRTGSLWLPASTISKPPRMLFCNRPLPVSLFSLKTSEEAREMDSYQSAKETYLKKKNSLMKVPGWAKGWFEWPDREHFNQCLYRHGFMALFGGAFPTAGVSLQALGGASCFALTMNRFVCVLLLPGWASSVICHLSLAGWAANKIESVSVRYIIRGFFFVHSGRV